MERPASCQRPLVVCTQELPVQEEFLNERAVNDDLVYRVCVVVRPRAYSVPFRKELSSFVHVGSRPWGLLFVVLVLCLSRGTAS